MNHAPRLSPLSILPDQDARFVGAARDVAILADGLMVLCRSLLLGLRMPSDRRGADGPVNLWSERLTLCPDRCRITRAPACRPVVEALCRSADVLHARLRQWGWTHADAASLGLVTDGIGVALTLTTPSLDSGPAWLLTLADPASGAIPVLPMRRDGLWALLLEPSDPPQ